MNFDQKKKRAVLSERWKCAFQYLWCFVLFFFLKKNLFKASLTYAEAQMRIDSAAMNDDITVSLRGLNKLAKILKKKRIDNG